MQEILEFYYSRNFSYTILCFVSCLLWFYFNGLIMQFVDFLCFFGFQLASLSTRVTDELWKKINAKLVFL